ncbi:MAG: poly(ADP-ribose) glycohydrolase domain-containing protein [Bacteroidia bacterium]
MHTARRACCVFHRANADEAGGGFRHGSRHQEADCVRASCRYSYTYDFGGNGINLLTRC